MFDRNIIINTQLVRSLSSGVGTVKDFLSRYKIFKFFFVFFIFYVNTKCYSYSIFRCCFILTFVYVYINLFLFVRVNIYFLSSFPHKKYILLLEKYLGKVLSDFFLLAWLKIKHNKLKLTFFSFWVYNIFLNIPFESLG